MVRVESAAMWTSEDNSEVWRAILLHFPVYYVTVGGNDFHPWNKHQIGLLPRKPPLPQSLVPKNPPSCGRLDQHWPRQARVTQWPKKGAFTLHLPFFFLFYLIGKRVDMLMLQTKDVKRRTNLRHFSEVGWTDPLVGISLEVWGPFWRGPQQREYVHYGVTAPSSFFITKNVDSCVYFFFFFFKKELMQQSWQFYISSTMHYGCWK